MTVSFAIGVTSLIGIVVISIINVSTGSNEDADGVICAAWKKKMKEYHDCLAANISGPLCDALKPNNYPNPPSKDCGCSGAK